MNKIVLYNNGAKNSQFAQILERNFQFEKDDFQIIVVNDTYHSFDRLSTRGLREHQNLILSKASVSASTKRPMLFKARDVSEIRGIAVEQSEYIANRYEKRFFVTGIVIDDVVFATHSINLPQELIKLGFGCAEGKNYAIIKTFLKYPNREPTPSLLEVNGFTIFRGSLDSFIQGYV